MSYSENRTAATDAIKHGLNDALKIVYFINIRSFTDTYSYLHATMIRCQPSFTNSYSVLSKMLSHVLVIGLGELQVALYTPLYFTINVVTYAYLNIRQLN